MSLIFYFNLSNKGKAVFTKLIEERKIRNNSIENHKVDSENQSDLLKHKEMEEKNGIN